MSSNAPRARAETKQVTRDALIAAGLAEFAAHGLDVPSLDGICARAGFTRGAFYVHFRDRDAFLEAVMEKVFVTFLDAVIATGDGAHDLEQTVERFATAVVAATGPGPRLQAIEISVHRVLDACARSPALRDRFAALVLGGGERVTAAVRRGQSAGLVRSDIDAASLGHLLVLLALGVLTAADAGVPLHAEESQQAVLGLLRPASKPGR